MDEYVGIPRDHPESYHSFMWKHLFKHVDVSCVFEGSTCGMCFTPTSLTPAACSPANVNILDGNAPDLQAECDRYEAKISSLGGIELFLGGIGPDGHIAFSEMGCWPRGYAAAPRSPSCVRPAQTSPARA